MGFLGHNPGFRHARRSFKGSIDTDNNLIPKKIWAKKIIGLASKDSQSWSKIQKHPHFVTSPQENPKPK